MDMRREWAMPSSDTLSIRPIHDWAMQFVGEVVIDPFARNCKLGTITNDLDPSTAAQHHMDALEFAEMLRRDNVQADTLLFDPPYSARQLSECYTALGMSVTMQDTQGAWWSNMKAACVGLVRPGGMLLSFAWNSVGFGLKHGCELQSVLLVCHGGSHYDTICVAERKIQRTMF